MEWRRRRRTTGRARALRRDATDAEQELWARLREAGIAKFHRQHPLGRYVVDFVCLEAGLVIEVDGGQHASDPRDAGRDRDLEERGFHVLRFWNNEVLSNAEGVMARIVEALSRLREREGPAKREGEGRRRSRWNPAATSPAPAARALTPTLSREREREKERP